MATTRRRGPQVIAVAEDGELDPKHFLGRLTFSTLPDDPVSLHKLVRAWDKAGLDLDLLPEKRTGTHIFQSACRSVETRKRNGHDVEIKVDQVLENGVECVYQITRMVRDRRQQLIEHPKALTLAFDKDKGEITVRELEDYDQLAGIEEKVRTNFKANTKTIPGPKVRRAIRLQLAAIGAQNVRGKAGGVYFVPMEYQVRPPNGAPAAYSPTKPILDGLRDVLSEMYGDRGDFYSFPLANGDGEREMVRKHFTVNVGDQAQELAAKVISRVRESAKSGRAPRSDFKTNVYRDFRRLRGSVEQFDDLVSLERKDIEGSLADLEDAIAQLEKLDS